MTPEAADPRGPVIVTTTEPPEVDRLEYAHARRRSTDEPDYRLTFPDAGVTVDLTARQLHTLINRAERAARPEEAEAPARRFYDH